MEKKEIIELSCKAGKIILENGGEIYRVEQTMTAVCAAYGIQCESFATPTVIMLSAPVDGESYCRMMRIVERGIDLNKVAAVNNFSRSLPFDGAREELERIENSPPYPLWGRILASSVGVGAFTIVFGGSVREIAGGAILGAVARLVVTALQKRRLGDFMVNLVGGATAALGGWAMSQIGLGSDPWIMTVATMMLLVPGLLFTNALRDIASGDLVSGGSRGMEALSVAVALACGTAAVYAILALIGGGIV